MSTDKAHFIVMKLQKYESKQVFATGATSLLHWSMMDVEIESAGRFDLTILMKQKDQSWTRCLLSPWTTITISPSSSTAWGRPSTRMSSLPSRSQCSSLLRIEKRMFFLWQGIEDLLARGGSKKILPVIPQLIIPIKCEHCPDQDDPGD